MMKIKLPKNLMFDRPCVFFSNEQYLMLAEEEKIYKLLDTMPVVIGAGREFYLRVYEAMCVLENYGSELEIPETFQLHLPGCSAILIETEEFLLGKALSNLQYGKRENVFRRS